MARKGTTSTTTAAKCRTGKAKSTRTTTPRVRLVGDVNAAAVEETRQIAEGKFPRSHLHAERQRLHETLDAMSDDELRRIFDRTEDPQVQQNCEKIEFLLGINPQRDEAGRADVLARTEKLLKRVPVKYIEAWIPLLERYAEQAAENGFKVTDGGRKRRA